MTLNVQLKRSRNKERTTQAMYLVPCKETKCQLWAYKSCPHFMRGFTFNFHNIPGLTATEA